ncbi:MAG: YciI family protein [Vicinamibacterales bacterium]
MRFLSIYKTAESNTPPSPEFVAAMQKLIEEGMKSGWLVATEGCLPSALGARVRSSGGKLTVTDGPFTESKEVVGGFAILEAKSKEDAIRLAREFLKVAGDGECELRRIFTESDGSCVDVVSSQAELAADVPVR